MVRDPFTPYSTGTPASAWAYEQLTPEEQQAADRAAELGNPDETQQGFARAVAQQSQYVFGRKALRQLGIEQLGDVGVVP